MQFLMFHLGRDRYGLSSRHLVRVLPLMDLKHLPQAPDYVAGLMNYHGTPVPVVDLSMLACKTRSSTQFDTRILLTDFEAAGGQRHLLGLMVEHVSHIADLEPSQFLAPGVASPAAPYLGQVVATDGAIVQLVELAQLLTPQVRSLLFAPSTQAKPC